VYAATTEPLSLHAMKMPQRRTEIKNKKAHYEYFLLEEFTAGMVLTGSEIKSLREGKASIAEAYCYLQGGELFVKNMHIAEYHHGGYSNHDPKRDRKLLLSRRELRRLSVKTVEKGLTIVPLLLFISDRGFAKLKISIARGKKFYDKRDTIKSRDIDRDSQREM
jgi:SsrA-binding protein